MVACEKVDKDGHQVAYVLKIDNNLIIVINIYGYNNDKKQNAFVSDIRSYNRKTANFSTDHIVVGGDFNLTPVEWKDRWPVIKQIQKSNLVEFINNNKLIDILRSLHRDVKQFTWYKPNGQSRSRIDYWLVSNSINTLQKL